MAMPELWIPVKSYTQVQNQPEKCATVNKAEKVGYKKPSDKPLYTGHRDTEF